MICPWIVSLANHVHGFIALERSPRGFQRKEAWPWFNQPLDEAMILFLNGVEIFHLTQFTGFWNGPSAFSSLSALG